ncbi:MAG: cellulase family glycosylhydrolase, partial [Mariniphaga sp.]|nr:cellulase family glycosylhydrolase [Mariniphaga sp.]
YTIQQSWLNRIEQVADWGLERGLFVIINAHHDDWIKQNYSAANKARFDSIWMQISTHFKDKPEKLIFEILNEPHGLTKAQNDDMHARVLSIIRETNPTRLVVFQGHSWGGSDELLTAAIPDDDYVIGSFHSYDPYLFGLEGQGTWGTSYDYLQLENKFKAVSNWSLEHNIPVFLGEFGALKKGDYNSRMRHYRAYVEFSYKYGFAFAAWDDGGDFRIMERQQRDWDEVKDILLHTNEKSPVPSLKILQDSIIHVTWKNRTENHDSILVQRKLGTQRHYTDFAMLPPDSTQFFDVKPGVNSYYNYRIIAHYNDSTAHYSQPVRIFFPAWTKPERKPFHDTPMVIPGIIEAEDFDKGGEGLTYHDKGTNNITGVYRPDDNVDIYDRMGDGYHVGNALPGEWMEYSVNVLTEGWYDVTVYTATFYGGGTFQIEFDTLSSGAISVPTSYSALNTVPVSFKMYLYPGEQIMRFTVLSDPLFNIDKMVFELVTLVNAFPETGRNLFTLYQNQNNELVIRSESGLNIESIRVMTVNGSSVLIVNKPGTETIIPKSNLPAGIYFIQAVTRNDRQTVKTIIR